MKTLIIVLFCIIVISLVLLIYYMYLYNKINESLIRIDEAEVRIDNNLRDKYDLLNRSVSLIKSNSKVDDKILAEIVKLRSRKVSNFTLDRILADSYNEFVSILDSNKELNKSDEITKIKKQLILIDNELITLRNYYNGNISNYNKMIKKFPTLIVAKIKKYKTRLFYDLKDMSDDDYEDFKL